MNPEEASEIIIALKNSGHLGVSGSTEALTLFRMALDSFERELPYNARTTDSLISFYLKRKS